MRQERVDLDAIVEQAVEAALTLFVDNHRKLHLSLPPHPLYVLGDPARLNQVIVNLLTNGLRYTGDDGEVWVSLEGAAGKREAVLRVRDNGIGLAPDQREAIFGLFVQVDTSLARSQGGLGLGLTLVRQIVTLHGGHVEAHSEGLGRGSDFRVYLPLLDEPHPAAGDTAETKSYGFPYNH